MVPRSTYNPGADGVHTSNHGSCFTSVDPGSTRVILLVHVDDIITQGRPELVDEVEKKLAEKYKLKRLGKLHHFLGMEVSWESDGGILL